MPNNPANKRAGSVQVPAANKLVRGAQVTPVASAAATKVTDVGSAAAAASTPDTSAIPAGVIVMWSGTLATIPAGWNLCDGTNGTPDLRSLFIKGAAAGLDPGVTGGAASHTPAGTIAAPTFTGNSVTSSAVSAGTPSGTIDDHTSQNLIVSAGTQKVLEGPTTHTFSGSALGTHTHTTTATGTITAPAFTGTSADFQPAFYSLAFLQKAAA